MCKTILASVLALFSFTALAITGAFAQSVDSAYTKLDLNDCSIITADDFGATFACAGYRGIPVMVAEGDLRMFVSFGLDSLHERAAEQTLGPFNTTSETLEWRIANLAKGWTPYATILRYFTEDGVNLKGEVLIVTKVEQGATCQVAHIDALKYKNANQIARDIADNLAADFDCANEPFVYIE